MMQLAKRLPGLSKHHLVPRDEREGRTLTYLNQMHIQNLQTDYIQEKINMTTQAENYREQQEYLRGAIEALQHLLDLHPTTPEHGQG